jgi:predicted porin
MQFFKRLILYIYTVFLIIPAVLLPCQVRGDEFKVIPSATISEKYNDNVFYTTSDRKGDWVTTLSPGLEVINRTERIDANLKARVDAIHYADQNDLNAIDQFYSGKFRYALTDRFGLSAEAGYARDSQPDRELTDTGLVFTNVRRERQNYGLSGDWLITDRTLTSLSYKYGKDHYDSPLFLDLDYQDVGLGFSHDITPTLKGQMFFGYDYYHVPGTTVDNYTVTIGLSRDLAELWKISIGAGPRYTRTHFDVLSLSGMTEEKVNNSWGWVGQASLIYKGEKASGNLTAAQSILPVSGTTGSGAAKRQSLGLDVWYRFIYELRGVVTASYFINKSDAGEFSSTVIDEKTIQVSPGLRYEFNRDTALEARYTYSRTDYGQDNTTADRHIVMVSFSIQHALLE